MHDIALAGFMRLGAVRFRDLAEEPSNWASIEAGAKSRAKSTGPWAPYCRAMIAIRELHVSMAANPDALNEASDDANHVLQGKHARATSSVTTLATRGKITAPCPLVTLVGRAPRERDGRRPHARDAERTETPTADLGWKKAAERAAPTLKFVLKLCSNQAFVALLLLLFPKLITAATFRTVKAVVNQVVFELGDWLYDGATAIGTTITSFEADAMAGQHSLVGSALVALICFCCGRANAAL